MKLVTNPVVTSKYGGDRNLTATNGNKITGWHNGIDIISKSGDDNIYAIADGKVLEALTDSTGSNTLIMVYHNILAYNFTGIALHAHCEKFLVKKGDVVKAGQPIAIMGSSGNVTGKHLHFSLYALPPFTWKSKDGKYYKWSYQTRDAYEINPNDVLKLY